jgi:CHC2 zinc finger
MPINSPNKIDTDAIRRAHDLADVITRELGRPARRGSLLVWRCPFHAGDTTPSFTGYRDGHYHCFGCGAHGDVITWTMQRRGLDFVGACCELDPGLTNRQNRVKADTFKKGNAQSSGNDCHAELLPDAPPDKWQEAVAGIVADSESILWDRRSEASAQVRAYLAARGLHETILQDFHIGYNPMERRSPAIKLWVPAGITIPTWHASTNTFYGLNVRLSDEARTVWQAKTGNDAKYLLASGSKRAPIGLESITGKKYAFVLEGEFDTLLTLQTLRAMGQKAADVGAFTMGSASSQDVDRWLVLHREFLDPARYLIATDSDQAGQQAAKYWLQSTPGRARLWPPPRPCKDITELWQKHGYGGVRWWILEALKKYQLT